MNQEPLFPAAEAAPPAASLLPGVPKTTPPAVRILFGSVAQLRAAKADVEALISKHEGATYSVRAGQL